MSDSQTKTGQKVVFVVAEYQNGSVYLIDAEFKTPEEAENSINTLPLGTYQVQRVIIKY